MEPSAPRRSLAKRLPLREEQPSPEGAEAAQPLQRVKETAHGMAIVLFAAVLLATPTGAAELRFREVAAELGVRFEHRHFGSGKKNMPKPWASGVAGLDYDGDGRLDLYFVQGARSGLGHPAAPRPTATDSSAGAPTAASRTDRPRGHPRTATAWASRGDATATATRPLVTNFGPNVLLRNRGDGTFEDATAEAASREPRLDARVVERRVRRRRQRRRPRPLRRQLRRLRLGRHKFCGERGPAPRLLPSRRLRGAPDLLYRNTGDGRFTDVSRAAGLWRHPTARAWAFSLDLDDDGTQDIYVANDSTSELPVPQRPRRALSRADADHRRRVNGTAHRKRAWASSWATWTATPRPTLPHPPRRGDQHALSRDFVELCWTDATEAFGLGAPSLPWVGFGTVFFDPDDDGDLDVFVANGHIIDNIDRFAPGRTHRQPAQLSVNPGKPPLVEAPSSVLGLEPLVGRGAVAADLDGDGDEDWW